MRPLRYSINVTLDGCCDHRAAIPSEGLHRHATALIESVDAAIWGRVIYEMMESAWRPPNDGAMPAWTAPFAQAVGALRKHVVSTTLRSVDWNAELVRGDLRSAVEALKRQPGKGLLASGLTLARQLAELDLIDEYEFVVHPRIAGHGPTLFAGMAKPLDLRLVDREELDGGLVVHRYEPRRRPNDG